jgi:hypothetical protein
MVKQAKLKTVARVFAPEHLKVTAIALAPQVK